MRAGFPRSGAWILPALWLCACGSAVESPPKGPVIRVATFNVSLSRDAAGGLRRDLESGDHPQILKVAEIIRRVRPDAILLNEFDYDPADPDANPRLFVERYLAVPRPGLEPWRPRDWFVADVNTGLQTGFDVDRDGHAGGPGDAHGFGRHHGQYGMVILSRLEIVRERARTFQRFRWRDLPGALRPEGFYADPVWDALRLPSKSLWDVPVRAGGRVIHLIASHPTPPAFDGPEDRNGRRNHDEIRLLRDYVSGAADYLSDDAGRRGGLESGESFCILGDLNADPVDGDSFDRAILQVLELDGVLASPAPSSEGAVAAAANDGGANVFHLGPPETDTADFADGEGGPGNLRVDYVLPSSDLRYVGGAVFWPPPGDPLADLAAASDHRLVFVDVFVR